MSPAAGRALVLLLACAGLAPGQAPLPAAPAGVLRGASLGWDGVAPYQAACPITVELEHPGPGELRVELVLRSGDNTRVEPLTLPAGARRRLSLAIGLADTQALVQLRDPEGGPVRESLQLATARSLPHTRPILALDGRPPSRRGGGDQRWTDGALPLFSAGAEWAPAEAACYQDFSAVYLRGVDPDTWSEESRAALLEHVLAGGTLLIAPAEGVSTTPAAALLPRGLEARPTVLAGRAVRELPLGLGRVVVVEEDLIALATGSDLQALAVGSALGSFARDGDLRRTSPPLSDELDELLLAGPGLPTQGLLLGFVGLYVLVVGPGLALFGRRARRRRLLLWVVGLIAVFTLLAPVVAGLVRAAPGLAYVDLVQFVPPSGPGVELGDVTVASGGSARGELVLAANGARLAATLHPADPQRMRSWDGRTLRWDPPATRAPRTARGTEVELDLAMAPWGRQSVSVVSALANPTRVVAQLVEGPRGPAVQVENLGPGRLGPTLLMDYAAPTGPEDGYLELGAPLEPGERRELPLRGGLPMVDTRFSPAWNQLLGTSLSFRGWGGLRPTRPDQVAPRYVLVSRVEPQLQVLGRRVGQLTSALRIDPVLPPLDAARGYLGLRLDESSGSLTITEVEPGSPAAAVGLVAGDMIQSVDGVYLQNLALLRERLSQRLAGEVVRVEVWSNTRRGSRTVQVRLAPRTRLDGGD